MIHNNTLYYYNHDTGIWTERVRDEIYFDHEISYDNTDNLKSDNNMWMEFEVFDKKEIIPYIKDKWTELWL